MLDARKSPRLWTTKREQEKRSWTIFFIGYKTPEENYYTRTVIGWELEIKTYVTCILSNVLRQVFCSGVFTCDVSILKVRRLSIYRQKPGWYLMKIFPGDISIIKKLSMFKCQYKIPIKWNKYPSATYLFKYSECCLVLFSLLLLHWLIIDIRCTHEVNINW